MSETDPLDVDGPAAPPRANGELVFTAPWQSRMFATTMCLQNEGLIDSETFRQGLIAQIADHEQTLDDSEDYDYWGCWQRALEGLLAGIDLVDADQLASMSTEIANRPPDH